MSKSLLRNLVRISIKCRFTVFLSLLFVIACDNLAQNSDKTKKPFSDFDDENFNFGYEELPIGLGGKNSSAVNNKENNGSKSKSEESKPSERENTSLTEKQREEKLTARRDLFNEQLKAAKAAEKKYTVAKNLYVYFIDPYENDVVKQAHLNQQYITDQTKLALTLMSCQSSLSAQKYGAFPKTKGDWARRRKAIPVKDWDKDPYLNLFSELLSLWTPVGDDSTPYDYTKIFNETYQNIERVKGILALSTELKTTDYNELKTHIKKTVDDNKDLAQKLWDLKVRIDSIDRELSYGRISLTTFESLMKDI